MSSADKKQVGHQKDDGSQASRVSRSSGAKVTMEDIVSLCKRRGFASGQTVDITSAHECPLRVTLGQREARPDECKNVTFVSRAMCQ